MKDPNRSDAHQSHRSTPNGKPERSPALSQACRQLSYQLGRPLLAEALKESDLFWLLTEAAEEIAHGSKPKTTFVAPWPVASIQSALANEGAGTEAISESSDPPAAEIVETRETLETSPPSTTSATPPGELLKAQDSELGFDSRTELSFENFRNASAERWGDVIEAAFSFEDLEQEAEAWTSLRDFSKSEDATEDDEEKQAEEAIEESVEAQGPTDGDLSPSPVPTLEEPSSDLLGTDPSFELEPLAIPPLTAELPELDLGDWTNATEEPRWSVEKAEDTPHGASAVEVLSSTEETQAPDVGEPAHSNELFSLASSEESPTVIDLLGPDTDELDLDVLDELDLLASYPLNGAAESEDSVTSNNPQATPAVDSEAIVRHPAFSPKAEVSESTAPSESTEPTWALDWEAGWADAEWSEDEADWSTFLSGQSVDATTAAAANGHSREISDSNVALVELSGRTEGSDGLTIPPNRVEADSEEEVEDWSHSMDELQSDLRETLQLVRAELPGTLDALLDELHDNEDGSDHDDASTSSYWEEPEPLPADFDLQTDPRGLDVEEALNLALDRRSASLVDDEYDESPLDSMTTNDELVLPSRPTQELHSLLDELRSVMSLEQQQLGHVASNVGTIRSELRGLRDEVESGGRVSAELLNRVIALNDKSEAPAETGPESLVPTVLAAMGVGLVLATWTLFFYYRVRDLRLALGCLVIANLVGFAFLLASFARGSASRRS